MTAAQVASHLRAKKTGRDKWIALCPAHRDRKPSLSIWAGERWVLMRCQSHGCDVKDILASSGLSMSDLSYSPRSGVFDPKAERELELQRRAAEARRFNLHVGEWILRFVDKGYTREDRERDIAVICACAIVLSNPNSPMQSNWERLLETHLARIMAAEHCRERGMLPSVVVVS